MRFQNTCVFALRKSVQEDLINDDTKSLLLSKFENLINNSDLKTLEYLLCQLLLLESFTQEVE